MVCSIPALHLPSSLACNPLEVHLNLNNRQRLQFPAYIRTSSFDGLAGPPGRIVSPQATRGASVFSSLLPAKYAACQGGIGGRHNLAHALSQNCEARRYAAYWSTCWQKLCPQLRKNARAREVPSAGPSTRPVSEGRNLLIEANAAFEHLVELTDPVQ